jgi:hypothetical protein
MGLGIGLGQAGQQQPLVRLRGMHSSKARAGSSAPPLPEDLSPAVAPGPMKAWLQGQPHSCIPGIYLGKKEPCLINPI